VVCKSFGAHNRAPDVKLHDEKLRLAVCQQLQVFCGSEFVVQRHQHATAIKNRIGGDQPLRLVGHDDGSAVADLKFSILKSAGKGMGHFLEVRIGHADFFPVAVGFD
jgi:hypothetical protein